MRLLRTILAVIGVLLVAALLVLWASRLRIATAIVDRKLAVAKVPASYRITRIGPWLERMEDVRIGDPAAPDLLAKRIDVSIGYGLTGPKVTGVSVADVQLRAALDGAGLHLGALDRLMPKSGGGAATLPDLALSIAHSRLLLATPNGALTVALDGTGNPAHAFDGKALAEADALRLAACALRGVRAPLTIAVRSGQPKVAGPIAIGATVCPSLALSAGTARVTAASTATFEHLVLQAGLEGFGGTAGPARFAAIHGPVKASGKLGALAIQAKLGFDHFNVPSVTDAASRIGRLPAGLPITPTVDRAHRAITALLADASASVDLDATILGERTAVQVHRIGLMGVSGARLDAIEKGGMRWSPAGWQFDGDVALGGGDLPMGHFAFRQPVVGAVLWGDGGIADYRAGAAMLALHDVHLSWDGTAALFSAQGLIDGPVGDGFVKALAVPVQGRWSRSAGLTIGDGCQTMGFQALRLADFSFAPARIPVCGAPLVRQPRAGQLRIAMTAGPIRLTGTTASGAAVALQAEQVRLTRQGFEAQAAAASLGDTHVKLSRLTGHIGPAIEGDYAGAEGQIANVPFQLSDGDGPWKLADGTLTLGGKLRIADAASNPRFLPVTTKDLRVTLQGGAIDAAATLHEAKSDVEIGTVTLMHRLDTGTGHALLTVPKLVFAPKALQPEALTPLTLGVVANVAGTITGEGRVDWSPAGVTSSGTFGTDRLDLAAAFGPVSGIKGQIHFTDLLGLVSAPHQTLTIAEINPGVAVADGIVHFQLLPGNRIAIEDARWPFASGTLRLEPTTLDLAAEAERRLTFRVEGLDAAAFIQQLDFPNLAAKGVFDGVLPMIFDSKGGQIAGGSLVARPGGGTLAYVGELSSAEIGTMGKLAFDALRAIRYSALEIRFDGRLDGEMISQVNFTGVREATPDQSLVTRLIRNLPFRFNIRIQAPFRGLVGSARAYMDPRLLLNQTTATPTELDIQPAASAPVR